MKTCWHVQTGQRSTLQALYRGRQPCRVPALSPAPASGFDDRQVGKQLEVLEYHAHAGTRFRQIGFGSQYCR